MIFFFFFFFFLIVDLIATLPIDLTKHFEEELSLLRSSLVAGFAGVATPVVLSDIADG